MTERNDREPVIVGWAQLSDHGDPAASREPEPDAMLRIVAEAALDRAGNAGTLRDELGSIAIVESASWPIPDPSSLLAESLGLDGVETVRSVTSGCSPIELLADACERIAGGSSEAALIGGVECFDVLLRAMKEGRDPGFPAQPDGTEPDRLVGAASVPSHPVELAAGLIAPVAYYPLIESALRASAGRTPAEHGSYLGRLWARFSAVAAGNPSAWSPESRSADEIATPSPANRQVSIPYTKLMNSNIQTNQAAALVVCSQAAADRAGIPPQDRIRVAATATAHDHEFVAQRPELDRSPALAACAADALGHAGVAIGEIEHLDLYSCFPSAVAVASREVGVDLFDEARPPTVTGGLSFAGGPGSNYVTHSLAAICERIAAGGGRGLATAVGWYLTKHGVAVLEPAAEGGNAYAHFNPQERIDAGPQVEVIAAPDEGSAEIEAYTAICDRSGNAELGIAMMRVGAARTVAKADDPASLEALAERDCLGAAVEFCGESRFRIA